MGKVADLLKVFKESIGDRLKFYRPTIKGIIMVFIGMALTRYEIGVGLLTTNFIFGSLSYLFISCSGLVFTKIIKDSQEQLNPNILTKKRGLLLFIILYLLGFNLLIVNGLLFIFNLYILIFAAVIGGVWLCIGLVALNKREYRIYIKIIVTLAFTLGLFYGALLNLEILPFYIIYFFIAASFLQFSREFTKDYVASRKFEKNLLMPKNETEISFQLKIISVLLGMTILFLILAIFSGIMNPIFYLYLMVISLVFIGISLSLSVKGQLDKKMIPITNKLLKWAILFELLAFIAAS